MPVEDGLAVRPGHGAGRVARLLQPVQDAADGLLTHAERDGDRLLRLPERRRATSATGSAGMKLADAPGSRMLAPSVAATR